MCVWGARRCADGRAVTMQLVLSGDVTDRSFASAAVAAASRSLSSPVRLLRLLLLRLLRLLSPLSCAVRGRHRCSLRASVDELCACRCVRNAPSYQDSTRQVGLLQRRDGRWALSVSPVVLPFALNNAV